MSLAGFGDILFTVEGDDIFIPNTKWANKNGLLYTINGDATILTDNQAGKTYDITDV